MYNGSPDPLIFKAVWNYNLSNYQFIKLSIYQTFYYQTIYLSNFLFIKLSIYQTINVLARSDLIHLSTALEIRCTFTGGQRRRTSKSEVFYPQN